MMHLKPHLSLQVREGAEQDAAAANEDAKPSTTVWSVSMLEIHFSAWGSNFATFFLPFDHGLLSVGARESVCFERA